MIQKPSYKYAWFCTTLLALCWLMTAMYLPALPLLKVALHTTDTLINAAISAYFLFFCISQLLWGPVSDNQSRNKVISLTLFISLAGTLLCIISNNVALFILGRSLQGFGIGAIPALTRSMINDIYPQKMTLRIMIYLSSIIAITCSVAPLLGAEIMLLSSWRSIFVTQFLVGTVLLVINMGLIKQQYNTVSNARQTGIFKNYLQAINNKTVRFHLTVYSLIVGSLVAFYSASPFVFIGVFGMSPKQYGYLLLSASLIYILAILIVRLLINKIAIKRLLLIGVLVCFTAGITAVLLIFFKLPPPWPITIPVFIYFFGSAAIPAFSNTAAMNAMPHIAGTIASLLGAGLALSAAILGYILSSLSLSNPISLALFFLIIAMIIGIYTHLHLFSHRHAT